MCNTGIACMFRMPKQISRPVALFVAMPANLGRIKDRDWAILMYISRTYCAEIRLWQRATEPLATLDYMDIRYTDILDNLYVVTGNATTLQSARGS